MVAYPIAADSPVMRVSALPAWLKPVFVVRGGLLIDSATAGGLAGGDYGYFLVPPSRVASLDRLFAPSSEQPRAAAAGLFLFAGDTPLSSICAAYGLASPEDLAGLTVADAFARRYADRLDVGDRIDLGSATLIVAALEGDAVASAGLEIDEPESAADAFGRAFARPLRLLHEVRQRLRARRRTGPSPAQPVPEAPRDGDDSFSPPPP
jgi:cell volume regulation protein A